MRIYPIPMLRCGTCGTEIKHVGYDPGQRWPAAEALGWRIAEGAETKRLAENEIITREVDSIAVYGRAEGLAVNYGLYFADAPA